ncbi:hypothetical protein PRIC1_008451 [Phytophthora ramorum]|nr:hypothetical protein KRP23_6778 [Phytophthora ramorum]KAH7500860.1 hypothetical protein KRP22_10105 [Phytophthora ramorum]
MATRARKRQRAHRPKTGASRALEDEEDHLLHMDPRLMTERQQLAFLLRTTAHEASDASQSSDESSEDETMRPPRREKKLRRTQSSEQQPAATTPRRGRGRPPKNRKSHTNLRVMTLKAKQQDSDKKHEAKPSPTGSDDVVHLDPARSFGHGAPRCALCCDYDTAHEASFSDALFLCPACDQKYPTQQALGRRACMT